MEGPRWILREVIYAGSAQPHILRRANTAYSCKFLRDLPHDTSAGEALLPYRVNRPLSFAKCHVRRKNTSFSFDNGILINFNGTTVVRGVRHSNKLIYVA